MRHTLNSAGISNWFSVQLPAEPHNVVTGGYVRCKQPVYSNLGGILSNPASCTVHWSHSMCGKVVLCVLCVCVCVLLVSVWVYVLCLCGACGCHVCAVCCVLSVVVCVHTYVRIFEWVCSCVWDVQYLLCWTGVNYWLNPIMFAIGNQGEHRWGPVNSQCDKCFHNASPFARGCRVYPTLWTCPPAEPDKPSRTKPSYLSHAWLTCTYAPCATISCTVHHSHYMCRVHPTTPKQYTP